MNPAVACPPRPRLEALVQGNMPFDDVEPLAAHLERCDGCAQTIAALRDADTLSGELRAQAAVPPMPGDLALQAVMTRLRALRAVPSAATATVDLENYDFLAPSRQTGELGCLAHYRVLRVLGAGSMGVVFQAEDTALRRIVALKVMKPALAASALARQRFVREAHAVAALKHTRIVAIYQVGEERGLPFLAMEHLEGRSLEDALREGKLMTLAQVLRIGREIAEGLAAAHQRGLIHRDIKPANVWLAAPEDSVKILDFGLARGVDDDSRITQHGAIVGTPAYMAPEQAEGTATDHRADLFSLGCVLYHLLTGQAPFRGDTTLAALTALATETPRPIRAVNPAVPEPVADLVMRLLARQPAQRPNSAADVALSIQAIERGQGIRRPRGATRRVSLAVLGLGVLGGVLFAAGHAVHRVLTGVGQLEATNSKAGANAWTNVVRSEAVGGAGGDPFEQVGERDTFLAGFAYRTRFDGDRTEIAYLTPIYQSASGRKTAGPGLGYQPDSQPHPDIVAKPGYAVGAIEVWCSQHGDFLLVRGFRAQFMRRQGDALDPADAYWSAWVGREADGRSQVLGGDGRPVVGLHGRAGGGIDSLGIIQLK